MALGPIQEKMNRIAAGLPPRVINPHTAPSGDWDVEIDPYFAQVDADESIAATVQAIDRAPTRPAATQATIFGPLPGQNEQEQEGDDDDEEPNDDIIGLMAALKAA